jgi:branched-chain amino acid transport system substrate-binding protein
VTLLVILAACNNTPGASSSPSAGASGSQPAQDPSAACAVLDGGCIDVPAGEPLTIALALTLTGDNAPLGLDSVYGAQVAQDERPELLGRTVEVVKEDAGCADAATGQTAAQAIVANTAVLGVIGTTCSSTATTAMPVLEAAGLIMISPSNTAPRLTNPDLEGYAGPNYFRTAYNDKVQGAAVADYACNTLHVTTAATIHDGSPYAEQLQQVFVDDFADVCGGTTTSQNAIAPTDTAFGTLLTTIGEQGPAMIFMPIFDPAGPLIVNQSQDVPTLAHTILFGADGIKDKGFVDAAGTVAEQIGMYFSGPDLNFGTKYTDTFLPALLAIEGTDAPLAPYHAHAYDAYNILLDAIESAWVGDDDAGTSYFSKNLIREHVATLKDYPGLTGTLTCDGGDCGAIYVSIDQLVDGKFKSVSTTRP